MESGDTAPKPEVDRPNVAAPGPAYGKPAAAKPRGGPFGDPSPTPAAVASPSPQRPPSARPSTAPSVGGGPRRGSSPRASPANKGRKLRIRPPSASPSVGSSAASIPCAPNRSNMDTDLHAVNRRFGSARRSPRSAKALSSRKGGGSIFGATGIGAASYKPVVSPHVTLLTGRHGRDQGGRPRTSGAMGHTSTRNSEFYKQDRWGQKGKGSGSAAYQPAAFTRKSGLVGKKSPVAAPRPSSASTGYSMQDGGNWRISG